MEENKYFTTVSVSVTAQTWEKMQNLLRDHKVDFNAEFEGLIDQLTESLY